MFFDIKKNTVLNFSYLTFGNWIGQIIPIFTTPIIARLYSPENYGLLAYYIAVLTTLSAFAPITGAYGIFSSKSPIETKQILWANLFISLIFSLLVLFAFFVYDISSGFSLSSSDLGIFFYLIPLCVFITLTIQILQYWFNRNGAFKNMTFQRILLSIGVVSFQILFAILHEFKYGLILGYSFGLILSLIPFLISVSNNNLNNINSPKIRTFPKIIRTNSNFLKFGYPSNLVNIIINQLPAFFFKVKFSGNELGFLNMSRRLVEVPFSSVTGSVSELYKNMLISKVKTNEDLHQYMKKSLIYFLSLSIPIFIILYFTIEPIINIYLGHKWLASALYSKFFLVFILFQFLSSPFSFIFILKKNLQVSLIMNLILLFAISISFYVAFKYNYSPKNTILIFIFIYSSFYLLNLFLSLRLAKKHSKNEISDNSR